MGNTSNVELTILEKVIREEVTSGNNLVKGWEQVLTSLWPDWKLKCSWGKSLNSESYTSQTCFLFLDAIYSLLPALCSPQHPSCVVSDTLLWLTVLQPLGKTVCNRMSHSYPSAARTERVWLGVCSSACGVWHGTVLCAPLPARCSVALALLSAFSTSSCVTLRPGLCSHSLTLSLSFGLSIFLLLCFTTHLCFISNPYLLPVFLFFLVPCDACENRDNAGEEFCPFLQSKSRVGVSSLPWLSCLHIQTCRGKSPTFSLLSVRIETAANLGQPGLARVCPPTHARGTFTLNKLWGWHSTLVKSLKVECDPAGEETWVSLLLLSSHYFDMSLLFPGIVLGPLYGSLLSIESFSVPFPPSPGETQRRKILPKSVLLLQCFWLNAS